MTDLLNNNNPEQINIEGTLFGNAITVASPLVHPPRAHKSRWTDSEVFLLLELLQSGYNLNIIREFFPLRSDGAIIKKAQNCSYRREINIDNIIEFKFGVKSRNRRTKTEVEVAVTEENCEKDSDVIVAKKSPFVKKRLADPNRRAVRMLQRDGLPFDPDVVCTLTKHIIRHQEQDDEWG